MSAEDDAVESNPKPGAPKAASLPTDLPAPCLPQTIAAEEKEEITASDYWSSPLGQAALADDWDEGED